MTSIPDYEYDVALSYASEDRDCAEAIAHALKMHDVRVFYDQFEKSSIWGKDLSTHLSDIYQNKARYCVPLLSRYYAAKAWTKHELKSAQARAINESQEYILPIRLDESDIPGILSTIAYLNWSSENVESITYAIMGKIGKVSFIYEDLRLEAAQLFANKEVQLTLNLLSDLRFPQIPAPQRWRIAALRGHCYFAQRKFLKAQQDFMYALHEQPNPKEVLAEQKLELMLLHLHLAETYRELQQLDDAYEQYRITLQLVDHETPFGYVAEAHWGVALITFTQANKMHNYSQYVAQFKEPKLRTALEHAENARFLYRSIGEPLRAASVTCQIAQIEQALGNVEKAQIYLREVLASWSSILNEPEAETTIGKLWQQEKANVVSAAACSLANIELDARNYEAARRYVDRALEAGKRSYKLRRAEAYLTQGRLVENIDTTDPQIEEAFRNAIAELADTDRVAARIKAHASLGSHLLKIGKKREGEQELEKVRLLYDLVSPYSYGSTTSAEDSSPL